MASTPAPAPDVRYTVRATRSKLSERCVGFGGETKWMEKVTNAEYEGKRE